MKWRATALAIGLASLLGCESGYDKASPAASATPTAPAAAEPVTSEATVPETPIAEAPAPRRAANLAGAVGLDAPPPASAAPAAPLPEATPEPAPVSREAASPQNVGKRQAAGEGYLEAVLRAPARIEDRFTLLNIQKAMDLYKGSNGHYPRSHDDFMRDIVQANTIQLPALRPGERYVYDPQDAKLYVERQQ